MNRARASITLLVSLLGNSLLASADPIVVNTDVAIIGGGAAGTYAAVRLRKDFNTKFVLIEPRDHLGGSVSTYAVPGTNSTFEYGVQSYIRNEAADNFFARFGIATQPFAAKRLTSINVNVETGAKLADYVPPNANDTTAAFQRWLEIVSKYNDYIDPGYWAFPLPASIPADLLVPFGDFAKQHQLEAAIPRIISISGVGYGGIRNLLTFNIMQAFGAELTRQVAAGELVAPIVSNSLVYQRALALLGKDVLLSSTVVEVNRTFTHSELLVKQGDTEYLVKTKRILFAAPPSLSALQPYHLDERETAVFSKFTSGGEYVGVAKITCIPENTSIIFTPPSATNSNQLALKDYPYSLRLDSTGPTGLHLFRVIFGANFTLTTPEFEAIVTRDVQKLHAAGTVISPCDTEFLATSNHSRPMWKQSAEVIKAGFVQDLNALQGYRGFWWTGYAWAQSYSSTVWANTDIVLGLLGKDLRHNPPV